MKEVEEALSSNALASTEVPSGAFTRTHVISNEFDLSSMAVLEVTMSPGDVMLTGDGLMFCEGDMTGGDLKP